MAGEQDKSGEACLNERDTADSDRARLVAGFAGDLRRMHEEAGKPSLRQMSMKVPYSHTALSNALRGVGGRLPSQDLTLALVRACGGGEQAWQARWHQEHARIAAHAVSRDRGPGATKAVPSEFDVQPPLRRPRRTILLSALGVVSALVITGVVFVLTHDVSGSSPQDIRSSPLAIQQLADRIPKDLTPQRMKERIANFSQGSPRMPGPWPFFIYDTIITKDDIGVLPKEVTPAYIGRNYGVVVRTTPVVIRQQVGTVYLGAVVWADCYVSNTFNPGAPKSDDVGARWLRVHWPTNFPTNAPALSSPTDPYMAYVYAGYALPFTHNGQIPSCAGQ